MSTLTRVQQGYVYGATANLTVISCGECGIVFAVPESFNKDRLNDHRLGWYCPNGHSRVYTGETEAQKLARQLRYANETATRLTGERDQLERSRRAWKGQTTKLRNRAAEGQCAFCGKFLVDLAVHVARQHPEEKPRDLTEGDAE